MERGDFVELKEDFDVIPRGTYRFEGETEDRIRLEVSKGVQFSLPKESAGILHPVSSPSLKPSAAKFLLEMSARSLEIRSSRAICFLNPETSRICSLYRAELKTHGSELMTITTTAA